MVVLLVMQLRGPKLPVTVLPPSNLLTAEAWATTRTAKGQLWLITQGAFNLATINGTQTWWWRTLGQNTLLRKGQNPPCLGCWQGLMEPMGCPGTARAGSHSPIHADSTQVEDGGCAQHHVHGHEGIAQHRAEGPHSSLELKRSLVSAGAVSFQMTGTRPRLGASATRFLQPSAQS